MVSWERKCKFVCSVVLVPFILFNAMKYLIAGLGNIGAEYDKTRHNIGFMLADALVAAGSGTYKPDRFAQVSRLKYKGRILVVIKPTTYMNLSGKAVKFWLTKENIPLENLLVLVDDLDLEPGVLRMRAKGSDGTHNGLSDISAQLGTQEYARLRFGIGRDFPQGYQVEYVLGKYSTTELINLEPRIQQGVDMIKSFVGIGVERTMGMYNNK